jgi:hypothetical protein
MKLLLTLCLLIIGQLSIAQNSDFIVLKKKNNRSIRSYFPGSFISGQTYTGARIFGTILQIRNDSLAIEQMYVRQVGTQFGTPALDTTYSTIRLHFTEIRKFDYDVKTSYGKKGKSGISIPRMMKLAGIGYIVLEGVNSAYRKESLSDGNKPVTLAVAAGVAAAGFIWDGIKKRQEVAGGKYRVEYIRMSDPVNNK